MKKPVNLPKRNIFEVPDGYFDKLPGIIQSRVAQKDPGPSWSWSWGLSLKYAVPLIILLAVGLFWIRPGTQTLTIQSELAALKPEQIEEYLDRHDLVFDSDLNTDDLVESVKWSKTDVDQLEKSVYAGYRTSTGDIQNILDEYDSEL